MISRRQFLRSMAALGAASIFVPVYAVAAPILRPRVTRYVVTPPHWPSDLDLTIAVIADLHACEPWMSPDRIGTIVDQTNNLGADVIALLGDYVAGHKFLTETVPSPVWAGALGGLRAPLGVHAVLGNHDWWDDLTVQRTGNGPPLSRRALEGAGIPVLDNDAIRLSKGGRTFWIAGLGDQLAFLASRRRFPKRRVGVDDLAATLAKVPGDEAVILLAHEPDVMPRVPARVSLVLSGHTHGGQIRMFGWSPVVPSRYGSRFAYGHVREQCDLIVSGGLGCSIAPVRLGVPPEIVLVTVTGDAARKSTAL